MARATSPRTVFERAGIVEPKRYTKVNKIKPKKKVEGGGEMHRMQRAYVPHTAVDKNRAILEEEFSKRGKRK